MAFYFVTGKLGNGKTLCSVGRIREKLRVGCPVATNIDLDLVAMFGSQSRNINVIRVPDKPTADHLYLLGNANTSYDESKNGLLVLDECGTWFNSRNWQDKSRKLVNDWFLHARKLGWDVILIVQDISIVDSQAREALSEHTVFCRRLDKIRIPFLSPLVKALTGINLTFPKIHRAKVVYGVTPADMVTDVWTFTGTDLYSTYDTKQMFLSDYSYGVYSQLTPWHTTGRYQRPRDWEFYMRMTKIYWRRFASPVALATGVLLGVACTLLLLGSIVFAGVDQSATTQPVAVIESDPEPSPLVTVIRDLYISGHMQINRHLEYQFSRVLDETDNTVYTNRDLLSMGVVIRSYTPCRVELITDNQTIPVFCL